MARHQLLRKTSAGWWYTYPSGKYDFVSWDSEKYLIYTPFCPSNGRNPSKRGPAADFRGLACRRFLLAKGPPSNLKRASSFATARPLFGPWAAQILWKGAPFNLLGSCRLQPDRFANHHKRQKTPKILIPRRRCRGMTHQFCSRGTQERIWCVLCHPSGRGKRIRPWKQQFWLQNSC